MAHEQATVHPINKTAPIEAKDSKEPKRKVKPLQVLPSERLSITKQLAILRAYAAASGQNAKPVKTGEAAAIAQIQLTTVSTCNPFFVASGLIQRTEAGFLPSAEVMSFAHAFEWNSADVSAAHKLASLIETTWFGQEVLKKIAFAKQVKEADMIRDLASLAAAPQECKLQVRVLIDYLEAVGLVQRDGDYLRRGVVTAPGVTEPLMEAPVEVRDGSHREAATRSAVASAFSQLAGGAVQFNVSVRVDMSEFKGWQSDRIAAFFGGIAAVVDAKARLERSAANEEE